MVVLPGCEYKKLAAGHPRNPTQVANEKDIEKGGWKWTSQGDGGVFS